MKEEGYKRFQLLAEDTNPKAIKFYNKNNYSKQKILIKVTEILGYMDICFLKLIGAYKK